MSSYRHQKLKLEWFWLEKAEITISVQVHYSFARFNSEHIFKARETKLAKMKKIFEQISVFSQSKI